MLLLRSSLIILLVMLTGLLRAQDPLPAPKPIAAAVKQALVDAELGADTQVSLSLVELPTGRTLADLDSDVPRKPASLLKLATMAAALDVLGPSDIFTTRVETDGTFEKDVLYGDLIIKGGGDPSLGPRFSDKPDDMIALLDDWAKQIRARGIRVVDGNVLGDGSRYTGPRLSPYWESRDYAEWYSAEVTGIAYNDNVHSILFKAGGSSGSRVDFEAVPRTGYFSVNSTVRVGPEGQIGSRIRLLRFADSPEIRGRGSLPPKSSKYELAAMYDPAAWIAYLFMERLKERGVEVKGTALNRGTLEEFKSASTTDTLTLITHESPRLSEMLPIVLGESQNLYAEMMLREVAIVMGEEPSFTGGAAALTRWLRDNRLHRTGFLAADGSGLGSLDRMTARQVTDILVYTSKGPNAGLWKSSLATPGTRSMRSRFTGSVYASIQDRLAGKTGYVTGAHTLAGYLTSSTGVEYAFSIMVTDYEPEKSLRARDLLDHIVLLIDTSDELN
ncbi:D-alanyl-D-alanine carboxypeptidase/D-alanyl-D-alanine-endopeptidase [bacterium]|nr:D-alanyl-D-alanine carboxypeptidase/D-alanyl-D-alanine-endopeptidase [bacterium]